MKKHLLYPTLGALLLTCSLLLFGNNNAAEVSAFSLTSAPTSSSSSGGSDIPRRSAHPSRSPDSLICSLCKKGLSLL